jgi:hypothetical protein
LLPIQDFFSLGFSSMSLFLPHSFTLPRRFNQPAHRIGVR